MAQNEISLSNVKMIRTTMVIVGLIVAYSSILVSSDILSLVIFLIGSGFVLWGCYLWVKIKGRHWAWMLFGLLAPIGLLALFLLKSKMPPPSASTRMNSNR